MSTSPTLPIGPLGHLAMDYAQLRDEGVRLLGRLAGDQWTDFNAHDPGITILEQLCYAITDLAYRTAHPIADLIAGTDTAVALPGPAAILTCDPVTPGDVRRLVLDVDGVRNALVEPAPPVTPTVHYLPGTGELRLQVGPGDPDAQRVQLTGLHRVSLQTGDRTSAERVLADVAARLHGRRGLCEDHTLDLLTPFEVWINAKIEVAPIEDPTAVLADIIDQCDAYLAPARVAAEATEVGLRLDELYDGPAPIGGFRVRDPATPRRQLRASDLIHTIMNVPAVRAVRSLALATSAASPRERWQLDVPAGHAPILAAGSVITLMRAGLPLRVDPAALQARLSARRIERLAPGPADARAAQPPPGRDRQLATYRSLLHQLPVAYGVGTLGLPRGATPERRAQAAQLAAYLLIFDQLLANSFAQLAHAGRLLSPEDGPTRTYFAQPVEDPRLPLAELVRHSPAAHRAWLADAVERTLVDGDTHERRGRFLAHLLARFAEHLGDHALIDGTDGPPRTAAELCDDRRALLRDYPRLSSARGGGHDIFGEPDAPGGLARRLRLKLGLRERPRFHVVEHILLRPLPEDARQLGDESAPQVPLLAGVTEPDPWSLQVSFVFEALPNHAPGGVFEHMVAQTLLAETPAHLRSHLHWFGDDGEGRDWSDFDAAWAAFRAAFRDYRAAASLAPQVPDPIHLAVRDARDRVIELLGFGRTYPLRDLPLPSNLVVAPRGSTAIKLVFSQRGVVYCLRDHRTGEPVVVDGVALEVVGTGGPIALRTPLGAGEAIYRILAIRRDPGLPSREAWLHTVIRVEEGVDTSPRIRLRDLAPLDSRLVAPADDDARLADDGAAVEVEILASQEGVVYQLLDDADHARVVSEAPVVGTSGTVVLRTVPLHADLDLRVHGCKTVNGPHGPEPRTALLDARLAPRIRPATTIQAAMLPGQILVYGGEVTLRLTAAQPDVEYRALWRRVHDADIVVTDPPPSATIDVPVDDGRTIRLLRPVAGAALTPLGEARTTRDGALDLPLGAHVDDALIVVEATRLHRTRPGTSETLASTVRLDCVLAVLVRPAPQPALRLVVQLRDDVTDGPARVLGGQPGVFYQLHQGDAPLGLPAYIHRRDDDDPGQNRGIDQLRLEVDLAIARDNDDDRSARARTPPLPPLVELPPLPVGVTLRIVARKARDGLTAALAETATLTAVPLAAVAPASVAPGGAAEVSLAASRAGERYRLLRGEAVLDERDGDGGPLVLRTGPLDASCELHLAVVPAAPGQLVVERRVALAVLVV